jgi:hypothetical protein
MTVERAIRLVACAVALAGAALRLSGFGRYGFWNDEAWVAVSSRVEGLGQFLLALGVTPIVWAALLRPLALLPGPPEVTLRLLPLGFGLVTLWLAWRLGCRLAGHALGGLFALALVALDPTGIAWAQQLKPYTTEAALALAAVLAADRVVRSDRVIDLVALALVLTLGATLSNAQLLVAPPLLATLALRAVLRRDGSALRRILIAGGAVGLFDLTWFALAVHPWLTPPLRAFWQGHYAPLGSASVLATFVHMSFTRLLVPALGPFGVTLALAGLAVLLATRHGRWAAVTTLLLVIQVVALSAAGTVPLDVPRTQLFLTTLLLVTTGAGLASALVGLWRRPVLRPAAVAAAAGLALVVARAYSPWSERPVPEDLGPLLRIVERERRAGDRILLYSRSLFVWGYYRTGTPVLLPAPQLANGFLVLMDDPDVVLVDGTNIEDAVTRAVAGASRVWVVGSRFRPGDELRIRAALFRRGHVSHEERRDRAALALLEPP